MFRKIIKINEEKCNGCGRCAKACHEGAIDIINGKAKLMRENFCDGLGDCLPTCPTGAISFEEREAFEYDEVAVNKNKKIHTAGTCPETKIKSINTKNDDQKSSYVKTSSMLRNWPCQIKLVPTKVSYFDGAKLLIAADCTAYAYSNIHEEFMKDKTTLIACPKLDAIDYSEKLTEIFSDNDILSVTLVRMEVPCCGGLQIAIEKALKASDKVIQWNVITISCDGKIIS